MNLIELLRRVKSGDVVGRGGQFIPFVYKGDVDGKKLIASGITLEDIKADDWSICGETKPNAIGGGSETVNTMPRPEATAIANLLRQNFDTKRPDEIVRELWLAMQLLATPESCADFIRRSMVIGN
ncbi:hypothetical protein [Serratia marcescens]|uniref:hypothetical protein n=1 Tax=Serratia marcescens TaxID=615 RepID=UPI004045D31E